MHSTEYLKQIIADQRESLLKRDIGIEREQLSDIGKKISLPHVHVITGIRRCGKSTFLRQIIHNYFNDEDFYYINFEDERLFNFKTEEFNRLYDALLQLYGEKNTFFIDEIQNVKRFDLFVRRFSDDGFKFFITGSNAELLSAEIGTKLTGRHIDTIMTPFTFREFLKFSDYKYKQADLYQTQKRAVIKLHFDNYLQKGGMPEYLQYRDNEILMRTYDDIVIKDIAVRHKIDNHHQLKELYQYVITNFAKPFSYSSLKKAIGFGSMNTVKSYLSYLQQSYLSNIINKFDYSLKKQIANNKKLYVVDNGIIANVSSAFTKDKGWLLENLVYNTLIKDYEIYYYAEKNECDFVAVKNKKIKKLVQVTLELNEQNKTREISGLTEAIKQLKCKEALILTYDYETEINTDFGIIKVLPVWKMLLE